MACPHFLPVRAMTPDEWFAPPLAPLGDPHCGECLASGTTPPLDLQRDLCNFGYARCRCPHALADAPDAVRFSLAPGAAAIRYSIERDHLPLASGELDPLALGSDLLHRQAAAYYESYRRRLS